MGMESGKEKENYSQGCQGKAWGRDSVAGGRALSWGCQSQQIDYTLFSQPWLVAVLETLKSSLHLSLLAAIYPIPFPQPCFSSS